MDAPEPQRSINLPSAGPWFTAQVGMVKHTINLAHVAQLTSGGAGSVTVHLSNGEQIALGVKDSIRLLDAIGRK